MRDYIELTKPRITWLILMSTGIGYFFGLPSRAWGDINWLLLFHTIVGTGLMVSRGEAGAMSNQVIAQPKNRKAIAQTI